MYVIQWFNATTCLQTSCYAYCSDVDVRPVRRDVMRTCRAVTDDTDAADVLLRG